MGTGLDFYQSCRFFSFERLCIERASLGPNMSIITFVLFGCNANETYIAALVRLLSCFLMDLQYLFVAQGGVGLFSTHPFVAGDGNCK